MKANQNRCVLWLLPVAISCAGSPLCAQEDNAARQMAAQTREWRLDGTIVSLDGNRGVLRLQPDVLVMRAEGDAVALGAQGENATRLILTDAETQMWTPDGKLRPLDFAALRAAMQIVAIGPLQNNGDQTMLRARLVMLSDGLPADYRPTPTPTPRHAPPTIAAPQVLAPPQFSPPTNRPHILAPSLDALQTPPQVLATPHHPPQISPPTERPQLLAPPQISAPQTVPQVLAPTITPEAPLQVLAVPRVLRNSPPPLPVAPPLVNRAPQQDETRRAATNAVALRESPPLDGSERAMLSDDDWSRRVPAPTLSTAPGNDANVPHVLAPRESSPRRAVIENRAVQPPEIERALPLAPDTRRPALSRSENMLAGRGALAAAPPLRRAIPDIADGRAVLNLEDAQNLLQQQQTAALARQNYAQLRAIQSSVPWPTFSNGPSDEKIVALTFDDGPHPTGTPAILEQLRRFKVPATFFVVGRNVEKHPELLRAEAAAGHDIANHSWHHFQGVKLSAEQWREEIAGNNRIIENVLGVAPRWFRAPGCHYSSEALSALRDLDMVRADTSNNSGDWEAGDPEKIVARVLSRLAPGQVLLFHDSVPQTAQALPILLRELQARGYRCVTLSELAGRAAQVPGFVPEFHPSGQGIVLPANALVAR